MWCRIVWSEGKEEFEGVVPDSWYNEENKFIWWPPVVNADKFIREQREPNTNWKKFPTVKLKLRSDSFEECDACAITTACESDAPEDECLEKRAKKKKNYDGFILESEGPSDDTHDSSPKEKLLSKDPQAHADQSVPSLPIPPRKTSSSSIGNSKSSSQSLFVDKSSSLEKSRPSSPSPLSHDKSKSSSWSSSSHDKSKSSSTPHDKSKSSSTSHDKSKSSSTSHDKSQSSSSHDKSKSSSTPHDKSKSSSSSSHDKSKSSSSSSHDKSKSLSTPLNMSKSSSSSSHDKSKSSSSSSHDKSKSSSTPHDKSKSSRSRSRTRSEIFKSRSRSISRSISRSPRGRSRSPRGRSRSPLSRSRSPLSRSRSPLSRSRSPLSRSRSPLSRSRSPRSRSTEQTFPMSVAKYQQTSLRILLEIRRLLKQSIRSQEAEPEFLLDPVDSLMSFNNLEEALQNKETRNKLTNKLLSVGGVDVKDGVRNMLRRVMTNELMSRFNMSGHRGKIAFQEYTIYRVIKDVAARVFDSSEKEARDIIARTLKYAPDRAGGGGRNK